MHMKGDDRKRAAKIPAKMGKHAEAAKHYEQHGQKIDAAKHYFDAGQYDRAAQLYEGVSYFPQAAKCYEKLGQYIKAAENYEQQWLAATAVGGGGLIASPSDKESKIALYAGQLYEKGGAPERAADLYKRAGLSREAAVLAAQEGRVRRAAGAAELNEGGETQAKPSTLYEQSRRYYEAGKLAQGLGDSDRAIQLLQQVDGSHEHYDAATLILSQLFIEKNMPALAVDKLKRL